MLIFRYLAKEVFITLASLTVILLLIFMSNEFVHYLNRAASGQLPLVFIMKLMMLEIPNLMGLLLPLGFYMSLMIAYGRLYADNEMIVLSACGYSPNALLRQSLLMASGVAVFVLIIMLWGSPYIEMERAKLLRSSGVQTLMQAIIPGQFRAVSGGRQIFYVESMSRDKSVAQHVFLARLDDKGGLPQWDVLWADKAFVQSDPQLNEDYAILQNGRAYQGQPGRADYQVAEFDRYQARLPHPSFEIKHADRIAYPASLWPINNPDRSKAAELQWRFSIPLMVLTLTLIGVPLSRVNSRSGKFSKLIPAVLIFIVYADAVFMARDWLSLGKIPSWLGMWWIHLLFVILGVVLIWRDRVKLS